MKAECKNKPRERSINLPLNLAFLKLDQQQIMFSIVPANSTQLRKKGARLCKQLLSMVVCRCH